MSTHTFNVYYSGHKIDTVFSRETDPNEVKLSLINHDGYNPGITVRASWKTVFIIQGNHGYGHGWEDESEYDTRNVAAVDLREYRMNQGQYRIIARKVQV